MIKLFFITLLCVTLVLAESSLENFRSVRALDKPMTELHAKLVRRSAQGMGAGASGQAGFGLEGGIGGGAGGGADGEAGFGFGAKAGGGFGGSMGGGYGKK